MSLHPALPEPTRTRLCPLYHRGIISSCGGGTWQEGPKKSFSIVLGELEQQAPNFRSSTIRMERCQIPEPPCSASGPAGLGHRSFPRCGPAAEGLLSPLKGSQRNVV